MLSRSVDVMDVFQAMRDQAIEACIHSFLVGENGVVYEADVGPDSLALTSEISAYDPGSDWAPVR